MKQYDERCNPIETIVSQLRKCLKFVTFRGVILYRIQSFFSPRIDLNRHLLSCDTIEIIEL